MKKKLFYISSLSLFLNYSTFAQEVAKDEELNKVLTNSLYEPNYFSLLFGLFVIIGLIYATAIIYQKLINAKILPAKNNPLKAEIISSTSLGQNKNLFVVKVASEYILLGACQNNISYIKELNADDISFGEQDEKSCKN